MKNSLKIITWCFLLLGIAIRVYLYFNNSLSLYWDEVAIMNDATSIAKYGSDIHGNSALQLIFPSYGDFKMPLYIWTVAFFVKVFGTDDSIVRLPNLLAGCLSLFIVMGLSKKILKSRENEYSTSIFPEIFSFTSVFITSISPWHIHYSVTGFEAFFGAVLLLLSIYSLLSKKNGFGIFFSTVFGIGSMYCYYAYTYVFPLLLLITALFIFGFNRSLFTHFSWEMYKKHIKDICLIAVSAAIFILSVVGFRNSELFNQYEFVRLSADSILSIPMLNEKSLLYKASSQPTIFTSLLYHPRVIQMRLLGEHIASHTSFNYLFFDGDANLRHGTGAYGLFYYPIIVVFIIGLAVGANKYKNILLFLIAWWAVTIIPASIPNEVPHTLRSLESNFPITLIISFGLSYLVMRSRELYPSLLLAIVMILTMFESISFLHYYQNYYPKVSASSWQAGYKELAANVIQTAETSETPVIVDQFDDRFFLWIIREAQKNESFSPIATVNYRIQNYKNIYFNVEQLTEVDHCYYFALEPTKGFAIEKEESIKDHFGSHFITKYELLRI